MAQLKDLIVTGNASFTGSVQATTFTGALAGTANYALNAVTATRATTAGYATTAANATVASKLGTSTIGSSIKPIYLNSGTPTAGEYMFPIYYSSPDLSTTALPIGAYPLNKAAGTGVPTGTTAYGAMIQLPGVSSSNSYYGAQLAVGDTGATSGDGPHVYIRRLTSSGTWKGWHTLLDSNNYDSYAIKRSGGDTYSGNLTSSTGNLYINNGNIYAGTTTKTTETDIIVRSSAGQLYLYATGTTAGDRGLFSKNASNTSSNVIIVNKDNVATFYGNLTGNAASATTASNSIHAASADALSSVLPISQGGTSATTAGGAFSNIVAPGGTMSGALTFNKMIGSAENFGSTLPSSGVTNQIFFKTRDTYEDMSINTVIPVANGGTGATDAATARANLNLGSVATQNIVPVANGGTGSANSTTARYNLGLGTIATLPAYSTTTTDPGVGSSLTTGKLLFVYTA